MRELSRDKRGARVVGLEAADFGAIAALSPAHVAGYLRSKGWRDEGKYGVYGQLYAKDSGNRVTNVLLPRLSTISDFQPRMGELIHALAEFEKRRPEVVLFDLTLAAFDVIRVRSLDADAYGSIRFEHGLHLHEDAKKLVVAAANAAASPQPKKAWKGRRPEIIGQYLDHVRLGQTENASFSLTILSPYSFEAEDQSGQTLFDDNAFGRRVTLKFGNALAAIEAALAESVADPIPAFEASVNEGVSAEMCQALGRLADNDVGIQVSVSWSPAKPIAGPKCLSLTRQDSAVLRDVARAFARNVPEPEFVVEGLVEGINEPPERFEGSVVVQAQIPQQGLRKVRVQFNAADRNLVYDAAKNKQWVRVIGSLAREGKLLKLHDPHDFKIIEPGDDE